MSGHISTPCSLFSLKLQNCNHSNLDDEEGSDSFRSLLFPDSEIFLDLDSRDSEIFLDLDSRDSEIFLDLDSEDSDNLLDLDSMWSSNCGLFLIS